MLTNPEQQLIAKIDQAIKEEIDRRTADIVNDITSTVEIMRVNQGYIFGLDLVRNEIIPELVSTINKQRN